MVDWCGFGRHPVGSDKHREQADAQAVDSDEDDEEATSPIVTVSLPVWDFNCLFLSSEREKRKQGQSEGDKLGTERKGADSHAS